MDDKTFKHIRHALGKHAHSQSEQRKIRSPYQDNGQFNLVASAELTPSQFENGHAPVLSGDAVPSKPFKPNKEICLVVVDATYARASTEQTVKHIEIDSWSLPGDSIELIDFRLDNTQVFPKSDAEPTSEQHDHADCCGACKAVRVGGIIPLSSLGNPLGCGISFPSCHKSVSMAFRVNQLFLCLLEDHAPEGHDKTPTAFKLAIRFSMSGYALR
jgi:hypothetical protein